MHATGHPPGHATRHADDHAVEREKQYWEEHDEFDWMSDASKSRTVRLLPALTGDVLELCVGSGLLTEYIPRRYRSYTGLDISQPLLETLKRKVPHVQALQGNAEDLPFEPESFDAVLVFAGLHHLPHFERSIVDSYRVLRPGGTFVCLEPNKKAWYRVPMFLLRDFIGIYSEDETVLDPTYVATTMQGAGFRDVETTFLTPRLKPSFLSPRNRVLARIMYAAAALGNAQYTQSFFLISGRKA